MPKSPSHTRAFLLLGLVMLFWAGNSITGRAVRDDIPPFTLAFGRWLIAVLILLPFAARQAWAERAAIVAGWRWIAALGFLGIVCFNSFVYSGLHHTSAANALLLQASIPALVLVLDRMIFGTRAGVLHQAGVALSTVGVVAIVFRGTYPRWRHCGLASAMRWCCAASWYGGSTLCSCASGRRSRRRASCLWCS
ncbi:DMT family transporter [Novosphingobium resinovorum]